MIVIVVVIVIVPDTPRSPLGKPSGRATDVPGPQNGPPARWTLPDTNAENRGECPTHLYTVRFHARELWGEDADPESSVCVDLFETYLEPA